MSQENQTMFPEKDLIDVSSLDLIKYDSKQIETKEDIDKAVKEFNYLKNLRSSKLLATANSMIELILKRRDDLLETIDKKMNTIHLKISRYCYSHSDESGVTEDENGVVITKFSFPSGDIELKVTTKETIKIKPKKGE